MNGLAVTAGAIRLASGVSFLVAPDAANRLWGDAEDSGPTASLLLRSMGYRDALIGGMLLRAGLRGDASAAGWFLASAGADAADLLGGVANHHRMSSQQRARGLGGAALGIAIGVIGAARVKRVGARGLIAAEVWLWSVLQQPPSTTDRPKGLPELGILTRELVRIARVGPDSTGPTRMSAFVAIRDVDAAEGRD